MQSKHFRFTSLLENGMTLPETAPVLPLPEQVLMPGTTQVIRLTDVRHRTMVQESLKGDSTECWLAIPCLTEGWREHYFGDPSFQTVGTVARIEVTEASHNEQLEIRAVGVTRCRLTEVASDKPYRTVELSRLLDEHVPREIVQAKLNELLHASLALMGVLGSVAHEFDEFFDTALDWDTRVYRFGSALIQSPAERQQFLEERSICGRIERLCGSVADVMVMLGTGRVTYDLSL
jgi:Lon protease-like protein